ncbi:hypothetical protein P3T36_004334 [Kitasatospora sp. MAP12-15]|nr:hypothetical protein [Kitasatospora sp. MAP12-44]
MRALVGGMINNRERPIKPDLLFNDRAAPRPLNAG